MKKNFTAKIYGANNKVVSRLCTAHSRVFLDYIRSLNWKKGVKRVYLRVFYGKCKDESGKKLILLNDGFYSNQKNLMKAYNAFNDTDY